MSEDPKPKPDSRVPSFDELKAPKRPAAPPSPELGHEEKTSQIDPDVLRKALQQSQVGVPIEPAPRPPSLAIPATTRLPLQPMPVRQPPPPPGGRPAPPLDPPTWDDQKTAELNPSKITTDPETNPVARTPAQPARAHTPQRDPAITAPAMPQIKPQTVVSVPIPGRAPPPAPGSRPMPSHAAPTTDRMEPVTPDLIPGTRGAPGRAQAPVQASAPAKAPPDPSLHQTQLSIPHRGQKLPDPASSSSSPTQLEVQRATPPPQKLAHVTHPHSEGPFHSPRAYEPSSGDRLAAPLLDSEPPTKNERPISGQNPMFDIEADIVSEVKKLGTDPGVPPPEDTTHPGRDEIATGRVDLVEVLAHPASTTRLLGAFVVDALVLALVCWAIGLLVMTLGKPPLLPEGLSLLDQLAVRVNDSAKLVAATLVLCIGVGAAYTTLFGVVGSGRTLGRFIFGLRLVDQSGAAPSAVRALVRALFALLSFASGGLGFWLGLFGAKSRTLHDLLSSTFVVRLGPSRT